MYQTLVLAPGDSTVNKIDTTMLPHPHPTPTKKSTSPQGVYI